eukprot:CAMPEP_0179906722 /NCGR_PEP_ID=MMETSP0982-20121206/43407_1 /TAXON_ID=483367 /ORGANISM="non described non described, Strain CCMP 2436" /LENGTH=114 /DNA_ID=CAMNT_0021807271 /DNA_START=541 /DNA_END=885 /DNA_ORIENTATION=+
MNMRHPPHVAHQVVLSCNPHCAREVIDQRIWVRRRVLGEREATTAPVELRLLVTLLPLTPALRLKCLAHDGGRLLAQPEERRLLRRPEPAVERGGLAEGEVHPQGGGRVSARPT